jgi:SnoaL-like polyketide cyclase
VAGRWVGGGKHTGAAFDDFVIGSLDQPNTGKEMHFSGTTIFTLKDGKIVREIGEEGGLAALGQLGFLPAPNKGKKRFYDIER